MPNLQSSLNGSKLLYTKSSHHAAYNFNQESQSLFRNQPRFPFEYYLNITLNNLGTAKDFISDFLKQGDLEQIMPLVKTVDMPSMKIETTPLNQYNRKRLSQTKIAFEPIKMVFHDVADGKTLKFWDMYYRYYFADGSEPGKNQTKLLQTFGGTDSTLGGEQVYSTNTDGDKSAIQNIISDTLDNHNFGFNIDIVQNIRNLIQSIDIYQVHGGRFNQVTLVNPRISAFTHDVLNYAAGDKTLELTFMFEYEYAYYTIQNMKLEGGETNNNSTIGQFTHGDFLELTNLSFTQWDPDFIESANPATQGSENSVRNQNVQSDLGAVTSPFDTTTSARTSSSSLGGIINLSPQPVNTPATPDIYTQPFGSTATPDSNAYPDMNRTGTVNGS